MTGNKNLFIIIGKDKGLLATLLGSILSATALIALIITIGMLIA
jgi:hypothetical protein